MTSGHDLKYRDHRTLGLLKRFHGRLRVLLPTPQVWAHVRHQRSQVEIKLPQAPGAEDDQHDHHGRMQQDGMGRCRNLIQPLLGLPGGKEPGV